MKPVRLAWQLWALVLAGVIVLAPALAAPRANNAQECTLVADMGVVARALAEEKIPQSAVEPIMHRIYKVKDSPRGQEMMRAIIAAAYARKDSASAFAMELHMTCTVMGGNMDSILGTAM